MRPIDVPVQRAAVVGDQALAAADVLQVGRGPGGEQLHQLGVQRNVPVVAELAQRDPQPVPGADQHDRVGVQVGELAGAHAGAGQQLDDEPVAGVGAGPGGGHQPGRVAVVEELRQRLGLFRDVPGDDRVAGRRVGPVPLDDPLEERPDGPHPLPVRLGGSSAARPWPGGQPYLVVLDVVAAHLGDAVKPGVGSSTGRTGAARRPPRPRCPGRGTRPAAADTAGSSPRPAARRPDPAHCAAAALPATARPRRRGGGQRAHRTAACLHGQHLGDSSGIGVDQLGRAPVLARPASRWPGAGRPGWTRCSDARPGPAPPPAPSRPPATGSGTCAAAHGRSRAPARPGGGRRPGSHPALRRQRQPAPRALQHHEHPVRAGRLGPLVMQVRTWASAAQVRHGPGRGRRVARGPG